MLQEYDLANTALRNRDYDAAIRYFKQAAARHSGLLGHKESDAQLISETLRLASLCFYVGRNLADVPPLLEKARSVADRLGDRRSRALIDLNLGLCFYFAERRSEAFAALSAGRAEVEELGDEDILSRSAELLGLYFMMQGKHRDAVQHLERAVQEAEGLEGRLLHPLAPFILGFCEAYLGRFHRAVGILDSHWRRAELELHPNLATTLRATLGHMLLAVNKKRAALFHLHGALRESKDNQNALSCYIARMGLAYHHFLEGRLREARDTLARAQAEVVQAGIVRQYHSPWYLEMIFEFERSGYGPLPELSFQSQVEKIMREPNIHLRGVALRLKAREAAGKGTDQTCIEPDLAESEACLMASGDPVQLAKTRLEMARLKLDGGDRERACALAQQAWEGLSGYADELFPDDLRFLLEGRGGKRLCGSSKAAEIFLDRFLDLMEDLVPSPDPKQLLARAVTATNRFFGAERGGLFWFKGAHPNEKPLLRASVNLTQADVGSRRFSTSLGLIRRSFMENRPLVVRPKRAGQRNHEYGALAILCLPFEAGGRVRGVLYHDNSYLDDCFDFVEGPLLLRMVRHMSVLIDRIRSYGRTAREKERLAQEIRVEPPRSAAGEIVARSPVMMRLLSQADRIAASESIVLLLGETGVGKELFSRRIHKMSPRREGPYVIVDAAALPGSLVESELFGHEKGAFTGADRQKLGRIEMADAGTLVLDEVGEIPLSVQAKLLRVLEEKTFVRLGGTRAWVCDFRLIAASNRNLADEVAAGRFREDLYYRLNVVPLKIPPLRERGEDAVLLAHHFLDAYARRFGRPGLELTPEDEAMLASYPWPGNVRELRNVIERAVLLSAGSRLVLNLPLAPKSLERHPFQDDPTLDELERLYIQRVLKKTGGRIGGPGGAAEILGLKRTSVYNRLKKLGLTGC
ncbi:MAG: sigma 54-interacting transcriptional regulator [bacterium]